MIRISIFLFLLIASTATLITPMKSGSYLKDPRLVMQRLTSPLPPPMTSDVIGTWSHDTMSRRILEDILPRIIEDNADELSKPSSSLRAECLLVLRDLEANLRCGSSGYLRGIADEGADCAFWNNLLNSLPDDQRNWLRSPWVVSEFYFYRRIAEAFRYFETGYDMFFKQKFDGLVAAIPFIDQVAVQVDTLLTSNIKSSTPAAITAALEAAVFTSLWGNKMDLSLWPVGASVDSVTADSNDSGKISEGPSLGKIRSYILDDQTDRVVQLLQSIGADSQRVENGDKREISIIVDNAGYELVSDLVLGHCLIALNIADVVTFHTKGHPTFVSDALTADLLGTINFLTSVDIEATAQLAQQLQDHVQSGRFQVIDDLFWCQPTPMWDMPVSIEEKLRKSRLVFVKGDANYRRLIGERLWDIATPAEDVLSYWPVPVCALRTFKAEIGVGISPSAQQRAEIEDANWQVSGKWAVVQLGGV